MADDDQQHVADIVSTVLDAQPEQQTEQQTMSDSTLKALIDQRIQSSQQWWGTTSLAHQRIQADQYYRGDPLGNEVEGRSQVVSRDVAEVVDGMLPSLLKIFASGEEVVKMEPQQPQDEEAAKQATDYLNYLFLQKNEGFQIMHSWFKDALLKRNGIVKAWFETRTNRKKDNYEGLTQPELAVLQSDQTKQVSNIQQSMVSVQTVDPMSGMPSVNQMPVFNCTVMRAVPDKKICVANVPPDEFVIDRMAIDLETTTFLGQRSMRTMTDLAELGIPAEILGTIPTGDDLAFSQERLTRFKDETQLPYNSEGELLDKTLRKVMVSELYLQVDYDGDGIAEWRKVILAGASDVGGSVLLCNEEVDDHPFASITPVPMPHKFYGRSIFDQTSDIQEIKTVLWRGALDSIYLGNSPRLGAVEGQVNMDDLLDSRVGGIVRLKNPNALVPVPTINVAPEAFSMMEYADTVRENRNGFSRYNQGLDADSLNKTATGINVISNAGQQRLDLIARIFAETGVKRLFRRLFELACLHQNEPQMVRLRGKWVNVDPRSWEDKLDVTVSVGIGLGNKDQQMQTAMALLNIDQSIVKLQGGVQGPILTAENIYNKLVKVVEAAGWKTPEPYYTDPKTVPPQQPQPSPEQQKQGFEAGIKQIELQIKGVELEIKKFEAQIVTHGMLRDLAAQNAGQNNPGQSMPQPDGQPGIPAGAINPQAGFVGGMGPNPNGQPAAA